MRRAPNSEQLKAIEHFGGVLLEAGAGSGKTFVLVEHIIYLTNKFFEDVPKNEFKDIKLVRKKLSDYYKKIVLMTFTKKAAGELSIRIREEFITLKEESKELDDKLKWEIAGDSLGQLSVSTIHGFCFKLIKAGYFPDIDPDLEMISEASLQIKLSKLFDEWFEINAGLIDTSSAFRNLVAVKSNIIKALQNVFNEADIRLSWEKTSSLNLVTEDILKRILELNNYSEMLFGFDLNHFSESKDKSWFKFLEKYNESVLPQSNLLLKLQALSDLFVSTSRMPSVKQSKGPQEAEDLFEKIKSLREFLKENLEDILMYEKYKDSDISSWFMHLKSCFEYVNNKYLIDGKITFSDIEYIVLKNLENSELTKKINADFNYFIIDEFQDTSFVQFKIVNQILQADLSKLFCVGDPKQAIYGFRGGELGVFYQCKENISQVLSLKNNYRSTPEVIRFNNNIFDSVFKMGIGFEGKDNFSVPVEYQDIPEVGKPFPHQGIVQKISSMYNYEGKALTEVEKNYYEALTICEKIKDLGNEKIAILYKSLKPSKILIDLLIKNNLSFTAQVKLPYKEDPFLGIFSTLITSTLEDDKEHSKHYLDFFISNYLKFLNVQYNNVSLLIDNFFQEEFAIGLFPAFTKFLYSLGICNSNYQNNIKKIEDLCDEMHEDKEKILLALRSTSDEKYSIDFQYGQDPSRIQIMTAHASKGLEFNNVFVGGIYSNGRTIPNTSSIGKEIGSFKWSLNSNDKKLFKTPMFILENMISKLKDFAESKRLFYVASTRAEHALYFIELNTGVADAKPWANSWKLGIDAWINEFSTNSQDQIKKFNSTEEISISEKIDSSMLTKLDFDPPFFHSDSIGTKIREDNNQIAVLSELSVTRLTTLLECPRKFFLENTCKIQEDDLKWISNTENTQVEYETANVEFSSNSAERGTQLHKALSDLILNSFQMTDEINLEPKDLEKINWVIENLKNIKDAKYISEEQIKFPLFNFMITGIPDLLVQTKDRVEIWDFKTGKIKQNTQDKYWIQLKSYAYALFLLNQVSQKQSISLKLCYLDEQHIEEMVVSFDQVKNDLFKIWQLVDRPYQTNIDSCKYCSFGNICQL